ncbi:MAG: HIT domain-containing protein [Candidatus Woesearchaeota archaeon]
MSQQCIFCEIVKGNVSSFKVLEANEFMVILDINPAERGHMIIIPKRHVSMLEELNELELKELSYLLNYLISKTEKTLECKGFQFYSAIGNKAGQRIDHLLFHLIPVYENIPLEFRFQNFDEKEVNDIAKRFRELISKDEKK